MTQDKTSLREAERKMIQEDLKELADLDLFLSMVEYSRSVSPTTASSLRLRVAAMLHTMEAMIEQVDCTPMGPARARMVEPLRRWRAARDRIAAGSRVKPE